MGEAGLMEECRAGGLKVSPLPCSKLAGSQGVRGLGGGWGNMELMSPGFASSEQSSYGGRVWAAGNRSSEMTTT